MAIDLFTGLHGWADGLIAEGWRVVGFDIEDMSAQFGQLKPEHFHLVLQDVLTLCGKQFKDAGLIVCSPPCQFFSYTAMPWTRAKTLAAEVRADPVRLEKELALFNACFRIQREASEAAGRKIPLVVENVRGAQPWVGRARWMYGSFALFGDVPALMPVAFKGFKSSGMNWSDPTKRGQDFTRVAGNQAIKNAGGSWFNIAHNPTSGKGQNPDGRKVPGGGADGWFGKNDNPLRQHHSKHPKRKFASAMIAKIPLPLSRHIARTFLP